MASTSRQAKENRPTSSEVDHQVNAAFTAFAATLGTRFQTGDRNIRGIVSQWCPLAQGIADELPVAEFRRSYILAHFFDRYLYRDETDPTLLQKAAFDKFAANVERGWIMNGVLSDIRDPWLESVLERAAILIGKVLGELEYTDIQRAVRHGPNSTTTVSKQDAFLDVKSFDLTGTGAAISHFRTLLQHDINYAVQLRDAYRDLPVEWQKVLVVEGNNLSFVPKKFDKLRTMAAEPTLNMFFQLGAGSVIADCLRHGANIDLASQPNCHQMMAALASKYPEVGDATVDWSEASDRIWIVLVQLLLKYAPGWFTLLSDIRSITSTYVNPDTLETTVFELPMIGTMGNGFTFPLQTLVFWGLLTALAHVEGVRELGISVFGDDCIVPVELMPAVNHLASELGWKLNGTKSFSTGGFRESCGADCFCGTDARPFFIERPTDFRKNSLKAWAYIAFNGMVDALDARHYAFQPDFLVGWIEHLFEVWNLGRIHVVPPRYSDASGVRYMTWGWPSNAFSRTGLFTGPKYYPRKWSDRGQSDWQWSFTALVNQPGHRYPLVEYPFYHRWLRQQKVHDITDWRSVPNREEASADPWTGFVALKRVKYRSAPVTCHTWQYWLT